MMLRTIRLLNTIISLAQGFNSPLTLYHCALLENRCPNNQGLLFDKVLLFYYKCINLQIVDHKTIRL